MLTISYFDVLAAPPNTPRFRITPFTWLKIRPEFPKATTRDTAVCVDLEFARVAYTVGFGPLGNYNSGSRIARRHGRQSTPARESSRGQQIFARKMGT